MNVMSMPVIRSFEFHDQALRTVQRDGEPWFFLADVCAALEHTNPSMAATRLDDDEKMTLNSSEGHSGQRGGAQSFGLVNESGLYSLILTSRKPEARQFKRWLTGIVLPSIRRTGSYAGPGFTVPTTLGEALRLAAVQADKAEALREALEIAAPKAAFVDRYVDSTGMKGFRQTAKLLGANEAQFRGFLQANNILYQLGGEWTPRQHHVDAGRFVVKAGTSSTGHAYNRALFTAKGVNWIAGLWGQHQAALGE